MTDQPKSTFARRIRTARPRDKRHEIRDDTVQGLMLRIFPSGARTFAFEGTVRGRRRYATLGNADSMTIPEARRVVLIVPGANRQVRYGRLHRGIDNDGLTSLQEVSIFDPVPSLQFFHADVILGRNL